MKLMALTICVLFIGVGGLVGCMGNGGKALNDTEPGQEEISDVEPSEEEINDVEPSEEEINDVEPGEEEINDVEPGKEESMASIETLWERITPTAGTATEYGIPLSPANTQQFIDWYNSIELSTEQEVTKDDALGRMSAPCCEKYTMSTCCCECNLALSVWGLSAYLITEKHYGADQVHEAALQWLHFIRPDYYIIKALEKEESDPGLLGISVGDSCFDQRCEFPFYIRTSSELIGGCGGMDELIPFDYQ